MEIWAVVILAVASIAGYAILYLALRKGKQKQEDYQAFAQSQGWQHTHDPSSGRRADVNEFQDPQDDWTLKLVFSGGGSTGGSSRRYIEWHTPQGALIDGEAVLGMPLPAKTVSMLQGGGALGQQIIKAALKATLYALGQTKFSLAIDEATAGHSGGVVMASDGQARAMDSLRDNSVLAAFRNAHKEAEVPVILRDEDGLKLRRQGSVKDLSNLAEIVALGCALRKDLTEGH